VSEWTEGVHIEGGTLEGQPCVKIWVARPDDEGVMERFDLIFPAEQVFHLCEALHEAATVVLLEQEM